MIKPIINKVWQENVILLVQLCRDSKINCKSYFEYEDIDGYNIYKVEIFGHLPKSSWEYYEKHRIKK